MTAPNQNGIFRGLGAPRTPLKITQVINLMEKFKKRDFRKEARETNFEISTATPSQRADFLEKAICLIPDTEQGKAYKTLLRLRVRGWSDERLAKYFGVKVKYVKHLEKAAKEVVMEIIEHNRATKTPLIGGAPVPDAGKRVIITGV